MAETIEITFEDGSRATWAVENPELLDTIVEHIIALAGMPDTVGP